MGFKYLFCALSYLYFVYIRLDWCSAGDVRYISTERPFITYLNKKYVNNASVNSRRISRKDPRYYSNYFVDTRVVFDNNIKMDFYFYEFIQINRYRRTFLEMHYKLCDMIDKDPFFGRELRRNLLMQNKTCPFPPGHYHLTNMTLPFIPEGFPLTKGRIYCNVSKESNGRTIPVGAIYTDMEIKILKVPNRT